ncbi:MAG: phosphoglycerate kinase [Bifidobacteriaceae bacterium]|nr:phosphoglycerate kinase [Bifidobacteriaceae bacterium]
MRTISDLKDLKNKRVLVRLDFNVPLDDKKNITDDGRILAALPTLKKLVQSDAKIIILAHLGRPKGEINPEFSLEPVSAKLSQILAKILPSVKVKFCHKTIGQEALSAVDNLQNGEIILLENVRFDARETSDIENKRIELAKEYAKLGDVFVSDGFGVVHRKQASVYDIAKLLPSAAGELIGQEVAALNQAIQNPKRPLEVILGGSKVSDKLGVISNLLNKANKLLICGGMSYTFSLALGGKIGKSLQEPDQIENVKKYMEQAIKNKVDLIIPEDTIAASEFSPNANKEIVPSNKIPDNMEGLDIGPKTITIFTEALQLAKTIIWNGPAGVFEFDAFSAGTKAIAQALIQAKKNGAFTVIGGGDSAAAVRKFGFTENDFSHISTGGGATLEFLEGKILPGLDVLKGKNE